MRDMKVPAIKIGQCGKTLFLTRMSAAQLVRLTRVDYWIPDARDTEQGYQRQPKTSRLRRTARFLLGKLYPTALLPTAVFLNARVRLAFEERDGAVGVLTIPANQTLWIVDGQHRIGGFEFAIKEMQAEHLGDYTIPIVITDNLEKFDEMLQFYVINTEQKKIRTDLANRLLQQQAKNPEAFTRILEQGSEWKIRATAVADRLNKDPHCVWHRRIQAPNEPKSSSHVVKEISLCSSLRPVVGGGSLLGKLHVDQVAELSARYWNALAKLIPGAFENPDEYVIQKTAGIFSLHMIFPLVFEHVRQRSSHPTIEAFCNVLGGMAEAEGGSEFWRGDNDDGASQYGSMKGFRILANRLEGHLPKVEVTI